METCFSNDGRHEAIETKPVCCKISDSESQAQDGNTAYQTLQRAEAASVQPEQQLPEKQKKTSFKFFGVRKSICTLPSFFSGRNKGAGKGGLKKSLCKSKTHDCISDATYGEEQHRSSGHISNGGAIFNQHDHCGTKTLPSSQSAYLAVGGSSTLDFNDPRVVSWASAEGLDTKRKEDKTLSFPKAKKGLKGLFNSMRRHKKNKSHNSDQSEPHEMTVLTTSICQVTQQPMTEPTFPKDTDSLTPLYNSKTAVCVESPSKKKTSVKIKILAENDSADKSVTAVFEQSSPKPVVLNTNEKDSCNDEPDEVIICQNSENGSIPEMVNIDDIDNDPASTQSTDRISLEFDDVSSLKSFDSLTGCGDIIADQDIDSIAESTISLERNRDITKRSSCLVTYQGGGEEMATTDELGDEYLQQLWEPTADDAECRDVKVLTSEESHVELFNACNPQTEVTAVCVEVPVMEAVDLLTPQSDQQRSVPNSDEGYYDSNTPGPDDESGDTISHDFKKDRLPRDSYSGDALYEFYEADDSLMTPAGEKPLFESEAYWPEVFDHFLDSDLPSDLNLMQIIEQQMGVMETEEDRLAVIQKQILQWERNRETMFQNTEPANRKKINKEKQNIECKKRIQRRGHDREPIASLNSSRSSVTDPFPDSGTENPNWRDFQVSSLPCLNSFYSDEHDQRETVDCHVQGATNGCTFDSSSSNAAFVANGRGTSGMHAVYKAHQVSSLSREPSDGVFSSFSNDMVENECEQAVSFTQALVDFTSNGTLFSSLSESLGSSDSGSSFTQNLTTLPTMVNFDIVDVENDGESEFDQEIEMNAEEEINASFEDFESYYVQKESFADCDEEMFHMDPQSALQNCNWGVASLPRHFSMYRLGSSVPAPLSHNRRSRSLDTESLEIELANLHLSKSGLRSCELPAKWEDKRDALLHEFTKGKKWALPCYVEGGETENWLRPKHYSAGTSPEVEHRWDLIQSTGAAVRVGDFKTSVPCETDTCRQDRKVFERKPPSRGTSNPSPRQMVRPSNITLQSNGTKSPEVSVSHQYYGEQIQQKLSVTLPLEEQKGDFPPRFCFLQPSENAGKSKPVGITQAMPQLCSSSTEPLKHSANYAECFEGPHKFLQKGRIEQVQPLPASWANEYSDCHSNQMLTFTLGGPEGV